MSNEKRLYTVPIGTEIVVLASSAEEAQEIAQDSLNEIDWYDYIKTAYPMRHLPGGWHGPELPFGTNDDKTIDEWIKEGAAPEYRGRR